MSVVPSSEASIGPVTVSTVAMRRPVYAARAAYACGVPRSWQISMVLLVLALLASMVIAAVKLV